MPGFTPNENFPYPLTTDPFAVQPDDTGFPQQSRDLAIAVQGKIDAAPDFIRRRPFFKMSMNAPIFSTFQSGVPLAMDTIEVDTVGTICDLSRAANGAFLPRGIWRVGCSASTNPTGSLGGTFGIVELDMGTNVGTGNVFRAAPSLNFGDTYDGGGTIANYLTVSGIVYCNDVTPTTGAPSVSISFNALASVPPAQTFSVYYAEIWGFWLSDIA